MDFIRMWLDVTLSYFLCVLKKLTAVIGGKLRELKVWALGGRPALLRTLPCTGGFSPGQVFFMKDVFLPGQIGE